MGRQRRGEVEGQLHLDWSATLGEAHRAASPLPVPSPAAEPQLILRLPWDFKSTFPQPTPEAIDAGVIHDEDTTPENVKSIHEEHARETLSVLHDLDAVLDARRRGVDPKTDKAPTSHTGRERLRQLMEREPARLEHWFRTLMDTYEEAFGNHAADAFEKAIRAWHAGIDVVSDSIAMESAAPPKPSAPQDTASSDHARPFSRTPPKVVARLPVPRPLPDAIAEGRFGFEEDGRPVRPGPIEVREITQQHADQLIALMSSLPGTGLASAHGELAQSQIADVIDKYAQDFGEHAAKQLEAYVRRQVALRDQPLIVSPRRR